MGLLKFIYQWGGGILMLAAFLIGIPDSFSATRDVVAWARPLGMQPIHLAFWLLGVGAIYTAIIQGIRIRQFEKSHPRIAVRPYVSENKRLILEVTNDGFGGDFSAKAGITKGSTVTDSLDLQWETNGQVRYHIDGGGGEATLLVGLQPKVHKVNATDQKSPTSVHSGELQLLSVKRGQAVALRLYGWEFDATSEHAPHYECEIEITITSEPTLLKPFKRRPFVVKVDGFNLSFEEMLIPHKGGSQT